MILPSSDLSVSAYVSVSVCVSVGLMIPWFSFRQQQLKLTLQLEISTFHLLINVSCVFNVYLNMEKLLMVIIFILPMSLLVSQNLHQSHLR